MSIIFCASCSHVIDPQEEDYHTHEETLKNYCEDCYPHSPIKCENRFDRNGYCICDEHRVLPAEPDVGINNPYLELR